MRGSNSLEEQLFDWEERDTVIVFNKTLNSLYDLKALRICNVRRFRESLGLLKFGISAMRCWRTRPGTPHPIFRDQV